jgi:hypothetical protein
MYLGMPYVILANAFHFDSLRPIRFQSTITANETKIGLHLRFQGLVPFNEQSAASESFPQHFEKSLHRLTFMKIGSISLPVTGHLNPMTALARKLQSRKHEVVFIGVPGALQRDKRL